MDYLKLGLELDCDSSVVYKMFFWKKSLADGLNAKVYDLKGDSIYTPQEKKIMVMLTERGNALKKEKDDRLNASIKNSSLEIAQLVKDKLTEKQQSILKKKYNSSINKATALMNSPDKIDEFLIKAEKASHKLPQDIKPLKYISIFISLIKNYVSGRYTDISLKSVIAAAAVIVYWISPFDIIPDALPAVGYLDETFVISLCLETIKDELDKFIIWKDENLATC